MSSSTTTTDTQSNGHNSPMVDTTSQSSQSTSSTTTTPSDEDRVALFHQALTRLSTNVVVEVMEALETLVVYTKNLILYPEEKKYRKIKISNIHFQERLGHLNGALEAMRAIGYVPV